MTFEIILLFTIVLGALVLFTSGAISVDLTALLVMVSLMATGILTPEEGISGFSNTATTTVLALLILSEGLKNTGAVELLGDKMISLTGRYEWFTLIIIMLISAFASAFINTTAVVAVFIPVMFRIARSTGIQVSVLLVPLSFAAMIGGASTMIGTSTNLLINSLGQSYGLEKLRIFDLTLMGGILFFALMLYMIFIGRHWLKKDSNQEEVIDDGHGPANYLTEIIIPEGSALINKSLNGGPLAPTRELNVLRVIRKDNGEASFSPVHIGRLQENDVLVVKANIKELIKLSNNPNVKIITNDRLKHVNDESVETNLFEALVVPNSNLIDRKIKDVDFRRFYDAYPLAVRKGGVIGDQKLMEHKISLGDILLMDGDSEPKTFYSRNDWITIQRIEKHEIEKHLYRKDKLAVSVAILLGVILLAVTNILPILIGAWIGVTLMVLTRCITLKRAYQNVEWKVVFLLAGIIPLGTAMNKTGADALIAHGFVELTSGTSPAFVVSGVFLLTTLLTGIISNQATAVLLVPIAIRIAAEIGMPPEPLVIAILFGANTSFLTPVGYQTNAMVYGPGNYKFTDFLKVGGLLCFIFWLLATFLIPRLYM
ncbi:SLC13 family permease [Fulvivirga kasyanovii]|uniref:SLC13 family permease n=1 Tax=Fulvivirga kasyanovii TaxID=396812 RepID=A0ABW9RNN9_9BACT|nr:SLC13 family permease [Fulvivirga kasyanovii]MTI25633.1 SLC13 family permease [Fulvivirga kasyanovii]